MDLIVLRPEGLYCPMGKFYIDPWRPVDFAVITHAHADHARTGHARYLCAESGVHLLKSRLGNVSVAGLPYGAEILHNGVRVSFHPAGHVLGSAQVRLEYKGQVWVITGDFKVNPDPTCDGFEPVRCHTLVTESTFALPIYRWRSDDDLFADINNWWAKNQAAGNATILYGYSLGKAQRLLAGVDSSIGPIVCHSAVQAINRVYVQAGVKLPPTSLLTELKKKQDLKGCLVVAPPAIHGSSWSKNFGQNASNAMASGWMTLRGARRRRGYDRGFALSDHADWPGLLQAISASECEQVIATHGQVDTLIRFLTEQGYQARTFITEFGDEAFLDDGPSPAR